MHYHQSIHDNTLLNIHRKLLQVLIAAVLLFSSGALAQNGAEDFTYHRYTSPNDMIRGVTAQSDGKVFLMGAFNYFNAVPRSCLVRMTSSGTVDNTFSSGTFGQTSGIAMVSRAVIQPDNKIIVGGGFTSYGGTSITNVVRLNPTGSIDTNFTPSLPSAFGVSAIALQPDGKILVGSGPSNGIRRLNADGTQDGFFTPASMTFSGPTSSIIVQPDGKILVAGNLAYVGGNNIIRLNADGSRDMSFTPYAGVSQVYSMVMRSDGKLLVGTSTKVMLLNTDGSLSTGGGFTTINTNGNVHSIVLQPDGKILICGGFTTINSASKNRIARFNANGTVDASFVTGTGYDNLAMDLKVLPDGRIVVGGQFTSYNTDNAGYTNTLNTDGSVSWALNIGTGIDQAIKTSAKQADGKLVIGGDFTVYDVVTRNRIARIKENGYLDFTFDPGTGTDQRVLTTSVQSDQKIIIGGEFTTYNGTARNKLARLNTNGSLDMTFMMGSGPNNMVKASAVQADGKIIIGGDFTSYNGTAVNYIARLNPDGTIDGSFNIGTGFNGSVHAILIQPDGKILVSGAYLQFNGVARVRMARLNTDGTLDTGFTPASGNGNVSVDCMCLQPDGKIVIGGHFNSYYNSSVERIARLNADGTTDMTFSGDAYIYNYPYSLLVQPDGKIIVGAGSISRVNSDGTHDPSFPYRTATSFNVHTLQMNSGGNTLMFGRFSLTALFKLGTGRLKTAPVITSTQTVTACGSYTWINGVTYTSSNSTATTTYTTALGTDSIITLNLTILPIQYSYQNETVCDSYTWPQNGATYYVSGQYTDTVPGSNGCDSIIVLNLTIPAISNTVITQSACQSYTWLQNGVTYYSSGQYIDTLVSTIGCDSLVTLSLTINQPTAAIVNEASCVSYTWPLNGAIYTTSGTYIDTIPNVMGCDSIVTLNLIINQPTTATINATACESYTWSLNGDIYTVSGSYTDTIVNAVGCDSIVTLNLIINESTTAMVNATACESYTWALNGSVYVATGTYLDTIPNAVGCDSIITLNLTINQPTTSSVSVTACESYLWLQNGSVYLASGIYTDTIPNVTGCDSIITLNLTINQPTTATVIESACGAYTWQLNGNNYTVSGTYTDTIPNVAGCDSIVTLNLTIVQDEPLLINSFSLPSDENTCTGAASISITGNGPFNIDLDNGAQNMNSSGNNLLTDLCPGVHDLFVTDNCGDTLPYSLVIPVVTNYVFNNPFIDSLALDSLGETITNCDIFYDAIDSAYIDSVFANGNEVTVIWNIIDANGSNLDTVTYELNNGNGVYWVQLNVYCPSKSLGDYFTVTQAIYFNNGSVATVGIEEKLLQDRFVLFPNPTIDGDIVVEFDMPVASLTVLDPTGRSLFEQQLSTGERVSLREYPAGIYLFIFDSENGRSLKRVVRD